MEVKSPSVSVAPFDRKPFDALADWHLGRLSPMPSHIPPGWDLLRLTSVAKLESGHTPSRRNRAYWTGTIPWVSLHDSAALDVPELHSTAQTISKLGLDHSSARLLPKGTVIFSRTATVGKATVMGCEMATSQDFANYVCGERVHNHYLVHLFRFMAPEWKRLMAGSTHNSIYMPVFQKLQVLLPPVAEQEAIAEALSDADALIESLEKLIVKKRHLKQGAMQELLTGTRRLPEFETSPGYKRTEIGDLPEDWDVKTLADLFTFQNGVNADKSAYGSGVAFINVLEVITHHTLREPMIPGRIRLSPQARNAFAVEFGDVLFNRTSETQEELGLAAVYTGNSEVVFGGFVIRARPRTSRIDPNLSSYLLRSPFVRAQIVKRGQGAIRANISQHDLARVQLPLPAKAEQEAIAKVLNEMDAEMDALHSKLAKACQLKHGMMQELLTGRTRLI